MKYFTVNFRPLPVGVDDFKKMITQEYYYADKTLLIKELLDLKGEVNLFTRPRRFGKTLNLSMLKYFFEDTMDQKLNEENKKLFHGLRIAEAGEKYKTHMCGYPVIHLTLKSAKQKNFEMAYNSITEAIAAEFKRHEYLLYSEKISEDDKNRFIRTKNETGTKKDYYSSLKFLSDCLYTHTGKKSIVLIDEYDVPLETAHAGGFYSEMIDFIRSLFESVLKNNLSLDFAVVTGCLRISRESIFTGLNNLRTISILDKEYSENFGFLEAEVKDMLAYYGLETHYADIKDWYDGYCFGDSDIYNPWSVINFVRSLISSPDARPKPYWANTSSNSIVKDVLVITDKTSREQIETLIHGGTILIRIKEETTYEDIGHILMQSISFYDNAEAFYHGLMLGLFQGWEDYKIKSNRESGTGRSDLIFYPENIESPAIIMEFKHVQKKKEILPACQDALQQIEDNRYDYELVDDGYDVIKYGICFCGKSCMVKVGE